MGCSQTKSAQKAVLSPSLPADTTSPRRSSRNSSCRQSETASPTPSHKDLPIYDMCSTKSSEGSFWTVMDKYRMSTNREDIMGEGTSSICRKAVCLQSGDPVAIKVYKRHSSKSGSKQEDVKLQKFKRQIQVLKELQDAFKSPGDPALWADQLEHAKPARLFLQLLDFSGTGDVPGPDPRDNVLYVVTELAQYSLKDYLALRKDQGKLLPRDSIKCITKAIVLVMAGLHSKGLVHIDLKPENLMMFNGRLKLIDVDGCVRVGSSVCIQDSSISFSPCYCAPEWARFLIEDSEQRITVSPALDAWSVGITLCELVTLDPLLKPMYANFLRSGHSNAEAGFLFMEWLSSIKTAPLPPAVEQFDPDFVNLLVKWLLVFDPRKRSSCAQCLSHPYIVSAAGESRKSTKGSRCETLSDCGTKESQLATVCELISVKPCSRMEDDSNCTPIHKGALFKLDAGGDPADPIQWRRRDMWITANGALCYFSIKDNKRLVLVEGSKLVGARINPCKHAARKHAFAGQLRDDEDQSPIDGLLLLACESEEDHQSWTQKLRTMVSVDQLVTTMRLGSTMQSELQKFRLNVKNRRKEIDDKEKDYFAPVFKGTLWKVKSEGDRKRPEDWFKRDMWLAKNGSLVYWSKKEERQLVYYTADDIMKATVKEIPNTDSFRPWAFAVQLPSLGQIEFAPGEFAAESREMRESWLHTLVKYKAV